MGRLLPVTFSLLAAASHGLTLTNYQADTHNRFSSGYPLNPVENASVNFIGRNYDWSAVAWSATDATKSFAFLSPKHSLIARHYGGATTLNFATDTGIQSATQASIANTGLGLIFEGQTVGDLSVGRLSTPLSASLSLPRYGVFDGNPSSSTNAALNGRNLIVYGRGPNATSSTRLALGTVEGTSVAGVSGDFLRTTTADFTYQTGDSGSPVFTTWVDANGTTSIALVGNAAAVDTTNGFNYINYLGASNTLAATNALMVVDGFALKVVGEVTHTWVGSSSTSITNRGAWGLNAPSSAPSDRYVRFNGATAGNSRTVTVTAAANQRGLAFVSTGSMNLGFTFSGVATLTVGRGGVHNFDGSRQTLGSALALGDHQWWQAGTGGITLSGNLATAGFLLEAGGGELRIEGAVSGTGGLSVSDGSLLLLNANTHSGSTFVNGGHLWVGSNTAAGTGTLQLNGGRLSSADNQARTLNNAVTVGGNLTLGEAGTGALTLSGAINLGGSVRTFTTESDTVFSAALSNGGLIKSGLGHLRLSGTSTYTAGTTVLSGQLSIDGVVASSPTTFASGALLGGSGRVAALAGAGTVAPGNSPGILTATTVDPTSGMDFIFEFTDVGDPIWSNAQASGNDVLRLTGASPFTSPFNHDNRIDFLLNLQSLTFGDVFRGGFFTNRDSDFWSDIQAADFRLLLLNAQGDTVHNALTYQSYTGPLSWELATVAVLANFASGTEAGYVLQLTVIPEPSTLGLLGGWAALAWAFYARRRRLPA